MHRAAHQLQIFLYKFLPLFFAPPVSRQYAAATGRSSSTLFRMIMLAIVEGFGRICGRQANQHADHGLTSQESAIID